MRPLPWKRIIRLWLIWSLGVIVLTATCASPILIFNPPYLGHIDPLTIATWLSAFGFGISLLIFVFAACWVVWSGESTTRFRGYEADSSSTHCPNCGYDLRGLSRNTPCPECGD